MGKKTVFKDTKNYPFVNVELFNNQDIINNK